MVVGRDGTEMQVHLSVTYTPSEYPSGAEDNHVEFDIRGDGDSIAAGVTQAKFELADDGQQSEWLNSPASVALPPCSGTCQFAYTLRLRLSRPEVGPVVVPWRISAIQYGDAKVTIATEQQAPTGPAMGATALEGIAWGLAVALLLILVLAIAPVGSRSRLAMLEAIATGSLIVLGGYLTFGLLSGQIVTVVGLIMLAAGLGLAVPLALVRPRLQRPNWWLVPIALLALPIVVGRFATDAEFRVADVQLASGAAAFVAAIGVLELGQLVVSSLRSIRLSSPRLWLVLAVAITISAVGVAATAAIVPGRSYLPSGLALPFATVYVAVLVATGRWLNGDAITGFIVGLLTPVAMGIEFVLVGLTAVATMFTSRPDSPQYLFESMVVVAAGALAFAILTMWPPPNRDPNLPGRALQGRWEPRRESWPQPFSISDAFPPSSTSSESSSPESSASESGGGSGSQGGG